MLEAISIDITSLNLSQNTALQTLYLDYCPIRNLDVSANTALTLLGLSNSDIESIDVSNNINLSTLLLANTNITSLDLSKNVNLSENLNIMGTKITYLDLRNNQQLKNLFANNSLLALELGAMTNLRVNTTLQSSGNINVTGKSFDLKQAIPNIDINKVSIISGAELNGNIVSGYSSNTPIIYEYNCSTLGGVETKMTVQLNLNITKLDSNIEITTDSLDKTYDTNPVANPTYDVEGSTGNTSLRWSENIGTEENPVWSVLSQAPTSGGSYKVEAIVEADDFYNGAISEPLYFTISKTDAVAQITTTSHDKTYDGTQVDRPSTYQNGTSNVLTLTWYQKAENGSWTELSEIPTNAGEYKVVATLEGDRNYNGDTDALEFTIFKAMPDYSVPTDLSGTQGQTLSDVQLPEGFSWMDPNTKLEQTGTHTYKAIYEPADTVNYETISNIDIAITVNPQQASTSGGSTDSNNSSNGASKKNDVANTSATLGSIGASTVTIIASGAGILGLLKKKEKNKK